MHSLIGALLHTDPILIYFLVAIILMLESTGVPILNNTLLLIMGAMASFGLLNIETLIVAALIGSCVGACCAYWIGRKGGRDILLRLASFFRMDEKNIGIMDNWFQKSGFWMIFFSRLTPFIRPFACFPAGIAKMDFKRFLIAAFSGSVVWCIVLPSIGWLLGPRWKIALHIIQAYTIPTVIGVVLVAIAYFVIRRRVKHVLHEKYHSLSMH